MYVNLPWVADYNVRQKGLGPELLEPQVRPAEMVYQTDRTVAELIEFFLSIQ